ncbi:sulfurtransferase [Anaeromyxobacter oryzae]|uniref:Sulfurtransferase n=1 Tax=Anaeromyxobacter oryzae TaxID=2918170 RepID=A0ABM7X1Q6_9BACT|nr:sulfurtransferase [Anaeromyxobacter oryzae]BDG05717.1 sulfurtransferase [Anaeromyxobacter oryzae]
MPLISGEELVARLPAFRVFDARPGRTAYTAGHVPGALHADLNVHLSSASEPSFNPAMGGRHPLPSLAAWTALLGAWGVGPETTVVIYDAANGSNAAARMWWMLRAVGHERVCVLDGGLESALRAGLQLVTEDPSSPAQRAAYPCGNWQRPRVGIADLEQVLQDPSWKVLDVRARERWRGEVETLDPVAGRIPGTVNLPFAENLEPDGRFKSSAALREKYLAVLGGTPPARVVVHCGSGVTACHTLLALEIAELDGASLYVGSYSEWCRSARPVGRG